MSDHQHPFQLLVERYEFLSAELDRSQNQDQRAVLLKAMKALIEEFDELIFTDGVPLYSSRERNAPRTLLQAWARSR